MLPRILAALMILLAASAAPRPATAQQGGAQQGVQPRELAVANDTDRTLQQLYVWRTGTPGPGEDRLGANVLPPRASLRVPLGRTANCNWEVRAVFDEGEEMRRRVDVCRTPRTALADTGPRREIEIANESDIELRELYVFPPGAAEQGRDRLGTSTVPAGETFRLRIRGDGARECLQDLRAVFADDSEERRQRLDLCRTPRILFGDPSLPTRETPVVNRARRTLRELYAAPAVPDGPLPAGRAWGPDRLGSAVIAPRESFRMRVRARDCAFDIRAVYDDDSDEVQRGIDLCVVQGVVFGDRVAAEAAPRRVALLNRHGRTIQQAFLSPAESRDWGEDVLGSAVLPVGGRFEAQAISGCRADLRIVFEGNAAEERREIDICAATTIALRPGWTVAERLDEAEDKAEAPVSPTPAQAATAAVPATPGAQATRAAPAAPAAATPPAAPREGGLRLRNAAPIPVVELYADPPGASARGPDRLGTAVLGAGESMALAPPPDLPAADRCHADLTAVFRDGRELRLAGRDLCAAGEVVLR